MRLSPIVGFLMNDAPKQWVNMATVQNSSKYSALELTKGELFGH